MPVLGGHPAPVFVSGTEAAPFPQFANENEKGAPVAVPVLDLKAQYQRIRQAIDDAVRGVLESGLFVLGPNVRALEEELASFLGVARAIALASGTDALHLTIHALGIGAGDLVLTSPFTFV